MYGGNTSCVEVRTAGNEILIFDAGTGIRLLGKALEKEFDGSAIRAHVFFSHFHIDHIQGLPFFTPLYSPGNQFTFYVAHEGAPDFVMNSLSGIMSNPYFPVDISKLPSRRNFVDLAGGAVRIADAEILARRLHHPQGCVGYRVTQSNKVIAYCTDVERGPKWSEKNFDILARDADCLIVDAQYTPEEYSEHKGWGHSSWKQAVESGVKANARQIVLFHHDPYHSDNIIDSIVRVAEKLHPNVVAASEGLEIPI